ncbi:MAG: ATP-dependent protease ATPase subunit HslU [Planctomycetales bacterium]
MLEMTPREVVAELDRHIVGQADAKRAVAVALRNRWRWSRLPDDIRREVTPKNIILIGPTGVGKTEITRRLANLTGAPLIKVEATKYTEVGYYGRDVESIVRDLVDVSINLVTGSKRKEVEEKARERVEERLLELLLPEPEWIPDDADRAQTAERHHRNREKFREKLRGGELEDREVEINIQQRARPVHIFSNMGMEQMDVDLQGMFERLMPKQNRERKLPVSEARDALLEQEVEALMDKDAIQEEAVSLAERSGIIFLDELDKICGPEEGGRSGPDVSRQGVQRDLLPIVEGTTVQTRYGPVNTEHMLFVAAGAFHRSKPSDLMPELQGRFPIRVELQALTRDDFVRILTEPKSSMTRQYAELLATDGVTLDFTRDGIDAIADVAYQVNQTTQNIGARRLHTILERLLENISFAAPDPQVRRVAIDADYVKGQLEEITRDEDLSRFIL